MNVQEQKGSHPYASHVLAFNKSQIGPQSLLCRGYASLQLSPHICLRGTVSYRFQKASTLRLPREGKKLSWPCWNNPRTPTLPLCKHLAGSSRTLAAPRISPGDLSSDWETSATGDSGVTERGAHSAMQERFQHHLLPPCSWLLGLQLPYSTLSIPKYLIFMPCFTITPKFYMIHSLLRNKHLILMSLSRSHWKCICSEYSSSACLSVIILTHCFCLKNLATVRWCVIYAVWSVHSLLDGILI